MGASVDAEVKAPTAASGVNKRGQQVTHHIPAKYSYTVGIYGCQRKVFYHFSGIPLSLPPGVSGSESFTTEKPSRTHTFKRGASDRASTFRDPINRYICVVILISSVLLKQLGSRGNQELYEPEWEIMQRASIRCRSGARSHWGRPACLPLSAVGKSCTRMSAHSRMEWWRTSMRLT